MESDTQKPKPTICIEYFTIADVGFSCTVLTRAEVVEQLRNHLIRYCEELGFTVVDEQAEYQITGEFGRVDQGSRFARSMLPVVAGAAVVQASGQVTQNGNVVHTFNLQQRKGAGFWGGDSRGLVTLSIDQIALRIASDAGVATGALDAQGSASAAGYLAVMTAAAAVLSIVLAWLAYQWAMTFPVRRDGMTESEKPGWAVFVGAMFLIVLFIIGLATAPNRVLKSRTLLLLRSFSGVSTIGGLRLVLLLLCLPPAGLILLSCVAL